MREKKSGRKSKPYHGDDILTGKTRLHPIIPHAPLLLHVFIIHIVIGRDQPSP
jgi:hypothetical protein